MFRILLYTCAGCFLWASLWSQNDSAITLEDIWRQGKFVSRSIDGLRSMKDGDYFTTLERTGMGASIVKYPYRNPKKGKVLLNAQDLQFNDSLIKLHDYRFSADENKVLIASNKESIYRNSSKAHFYVYDWLTGRLDKLTSGKKQRYATFSPSANKVAYVKENNLYCKDLESKKEEQLTSDGENNKIINGASDWVYEEELGLVKAFKWSPDGTKIAYYKFDESAVKEWTIKNYDALYPSEYRFKYPKAGEENSKVSIHVYDVNGKTTQSVKLPFSYEYIPRIYWTKDSKELMVLTFNRLQNILKIAAVNAVSTESRVIYEEKSDTYITVPTIFPMSDAFLITSEKNGFNHIYLYQNDGKLKRQVTTGNWEVTDVYGADEQHIYYQSTEVSPMGRQVYKINLDGTGKQRLSERGGNNSANFSSSFQYYINYHSDANTPYYITLHDQKSKKARVLEDNSELLGRLSSVKLSKKTFFNIPTSAGQLNAWMIKPPQFDATKKYPVLMNVYGGPGSQTVQDDWGGANYMWFQLLAQKGYVVVSVDGRGTGGRGASFKKVTYKELGKYETEDQISGAKYLSGLPYIDSSRIGIFGWSYGGYMSSLCITKGAAIFKSAIAVAPVTNWRYYDNIYTERYMQTPQENGSGYDDNSPINHVEKMTDNNHYLLVHGMADDNVHYQNAAEMIKALVAADKQFTTMSYPNKNHGIYGGNTRLHLYRLMTNYLLKNL